MKGSLAVNYFKGDSILRFPKGENVNKIHRSTR
jgi:hypothetical protein